MPCIIDILKYTIHNMLCALEEKINLEGSNGSFGDLKKTHKLKYPSMKNEIPLQVDNLKRMPKKTSGKNVLSTDTKCFLLL